MIKHLESTRRVTNSVRVKRRPKGWTIERRARQAAAIRRWQPWRRSTGPRTETGKERSAMNALKHGFRSRANILKLQRVRHAIRLCAHTVAAVRAHMHGFPLRLGLPSLADEGGNLCSARVSRDVISALL